jgi:tetratricopeptide (TPR) repeat protein
VLDAFNSWASLLEKQGRIAEALPLRRDALAVARRGRLPGGDLAVHVNNLALLCYRGGDWACAEAGFREALGLWRTEYGELHPNVATAHNNLGMALMERGRLAEAEAEVAAALALRRARSGEESVEVAISSRNIGLIHLRQGRLPLARTELDHAVELARRVYEPRHPRLAEALMARADLALAEKRRDDAARDLEEALAIREEKLGRDNPLTAKARAQLAQARGGGGG